MTTLGAAAGACFLSTGPAVVDELLQRGPELLRDHRRPVHIIHVGNHGS